jgi:hypothetical protein
MSIRTNGDAIVVYTTRDEPTPLYSALLAVLTHGEHDEDCAYRCLRTGCRDDHHCDSCIKRSEQPTREIE